MKKLRKKYLRIVFPVVFTFVLIVSIVFTIVIAQGRTIIDEGQLVQAGIIRLNIDVVDYSVKLDNKTYFVQNNRIGDLKGGNYTLSISKEGFHNYQKPVKVEEGSIEDVNVRLTLKNPLIESLIDTDIEKIVQKGTKYIFFSRRNKEIVELYRYRLVNDIFDFNQEVMIKLASFSEPNTNYNLIISDNLSQALVVDTNSPSLINLNNGSVTTLTELFGFEPEILGFLNENILFKKDGFILTFNTSTKNIVVIDYFGSENNRYSFFNNTFIFYKDEKFFYFSNNEKKEIVLESGYNNLGGIKQIYVFSPEVFVLSTNDGLFYINLYRQIYENITLKGEFYKFSNDGDKFLFTRDGELYQFNIKKLLGEKIYNKEIFKLNLKTGENIFIGYTSDSRNLLRISESNELRQLSIMDLDGGNSYIVAEDSDISAFVVTSNPYIFFSLGNNELLKVKTY